MLIFCCFSANTDPLQHYCSHRSNKFSFPHLARLFGAFLLKMSNNTTYFLVLFLISLASSACNARPIDVPHKEPAKDFQFSTKNNEKSSIARVSIPAKVEPSLPNKSETAENGSSLMEKAVHEDKQTTRAKKPVTKFHIKGQKPKASGAVQIKSLATVSWKLPQKKRGEKQPGFNLDYAPPKTHPPIHN